MTKWSETKMALGAAAAALGMMLLGCGSAEDAETGGEFEEDGELAGEEKVGTVA
jgi:hypothetical protein